MTQTRVFDGARLRATFNPAGGARLLVTFDFRKNGRDGFGPAPKPGRLAARGWDHLHLSTARNDWFLNEETEAAGRALGSFAARFGQVALLGYSMGAYGALRFAGAVGADWLVAVSPFVSLSASWEDRHRDDLTDWLGQSGDLATHAAPDLQGYIVVDPTQPRDLAHACALSGPFPGLGRIDLPGGGHPATRALREAGDNDSILALALGEDADGAALMAAHAGRRLRLTGAGNPPNDPPL